MVRILQELWFRPLVWRPRFNNPLQEYLQRKMTPVALDKDMSILEPVIRLEVLLNVPWQQRNMPSIVWYVMEVPVVDIASDLSDIFADLFVLLS